MNEESKLLTKEKIYHICCATFCVTLVLSNIISAKMITFPYSGLSVPAGLLTYPLTFLLSDLVTEFFGAGKAKFMVHVALAVNLFSFGIIEFALWLPGEVQGNQNAFGTVLGLSGLRIFSSLIAYLITQLVNIQLYAWIKKWTGPRFLWLRNNGSTCVSQIIDTVAIDLIFLCWGLNMKIEQVVPIMIFSYVYKALFSFSATPVFYFFVFYAERVSKIRISAASKPRSPLYTIGSFSIGKSGELSG